MPWLAKLSRLYQPRNPLFWLMVVFNLLSSVLIWLLHNRPLNGVATALVAVFALGNALFGIVLMLRLMREPKEEG
ncbi:hypothetical protein [Pseudothauera nasutitermitis]|uniref:hypothetical protein n=1 Tax=Pseudothauera nasutitermitis TaxID=2565930 RepID=UPI001B3B26D7|nr:hypothetical protein [Pseudothauera nasutitermitis]